MNILHILSTPSAGGAEIYVRDLTVALKKRGHCVSLGFVGHAIDVGRSPVFESTFLEYLEQHQVPYFFIGNECRRKPWAGIHRVRQYVKKHAIDIYHSHLMYGIIFGARASVPCIYTHHNIIPKSGKLAYCIYNQIVDEYVGISKICSDRLREYTGRNVTTILNGADASKFQIKPRVNRSGDKRVQCIAVGGFYEQKNYDLMIETFSMLSNETKQVVHLSICGEGPPASTKRLHELVQAKNLTEQITFLGNRSDVPDLLAAADLFLMSSAWEGLPIALIEASLAGLACIVTDVGGCSEVIETCKNGIVVPPADASAFANAITQLVQDSDRREAMQQNASDHSGVFSIENSCEHHLRLYSEILKR